VQTSKEKGATADEIVTVLVKVFPNRDPDDMRKTVLIQANKNCTSKEIDETLRWLDFFVYPNLDSDRDIGIIPCLPIVTVTGSW
jgi:hypothetical protein